MPPKAIAPSAQQQQQEQQAKAKTADQLDGELRPLLEQLAAALRRERQSQAGTEAPAAGAVAIPDAAPPTDFTAAWERMQGAAPQMAAAVASLQEKLEAARQLDDAQAMEWKDKGNAEYAGKRLQQAAMLFTRGLMYAKSDETVAVLLNNRAAAMLEQQLPSAALLDATHALRVCPSYTKALARRVKCLSVLGLSELLKKDEVALAAAVAAAEGAATEGGAPQPCSFEEITAAMGDLHEAAPPATAPQATLHADLRFESAPAKGRHAVAASRIAAGTEILAETPYAAALRWDGMLCACAEAFVHTPCLYPCDEHRRRGIRSRGLFSSVEAVQRYWQRYGEDEAGSVFWLVCPVDTLLAHRCLRRTSDGGVPSNFAEVPDRARAGAVVDAALGAGHLESLVRWSAELDSAAAVGGFETAAACAAVSFGAVDARQLPALVATQQRLTSNARNVEVLDRVVLGPQQHAYRTVPVAKALYATAALFNHSCDPNASAQVVGAPHKTTGQLRIRLLRTVMEGEEITISWGGIHRSTHHSIRARIRELKGLFGFGCACTHCANNIDQAVTQADQQHYITAADYYQKGRRLMREGNPAEGAVVLGQSLDIVLKEICPPPRPPQIMVAKTHDAMAQAYQLTGDKERCLRHVALALEVTEKLHGEDSPELPREYAKLAALHAREAGPEHAAKAAEYTGKAVSLMQRYYPASRALSAEIALLQADVKGAQ